MKLTELRLEGSEKILADYTFDRMGTLNAEGNSILSYLTGEKFLAGALNERISCLVCTEGLLGKLPGHIKGILVSKDPAGTFYRIHNEYGRRRESFQSRIGTNCEISPLAYIAPLNVQIGCHVRIEEFASIKEGSCIGDYSVIRAGSVIGGEGFQFPVTSTGILAVRHYGGVVIGKNVEVQQLCNVARAVFPWDDTVIGDDTKLDALVHIAHADKVGRGCRITAGVSVAGSVCIGDGAWLGVNAVVRDGIRIGKHARVSLGSVVTKNVGDGETVTGNFAVSHKLFIENMKKAAGKG